MLHLPSATVRILILKFPADRVEQSIHEQKVQGYLKSRRSTRLCEKSDC